MKFTFHDRFRSNGSLQVDGDFWRTTPIFITFFEIFRNIYFYFDFKIFIIIRVISFQKIRKCHFNSVIKYNMCFEQQFKIYKLDNWKKWRKPVDSPLRSGLFWYFMNSFVCTKKFEKISKNFSYNLWKFLEVSSRLHTSSQLVFSTFSSYPIYKS